MTITDAEMIEWTTACEAATDGPWEVAEVKADGANGYFVTGIAEPCSLRMTYWCGFEGGGICGLEGIEDYDIAPHILTEADARFIALARTALPRLIAEVQQLRAELAENKHEGDW